MSSAVSAAERARCLRVVYVCAFLDMFATSMVVVMLPTYLRTDCGLSSAMAGLVRSIYGSVQFFASPVIGGLSDQWGRRTTMLIDLSICTVVYFLHSVNWLLLLVTVRLVAGIFKQTQNQCNAMVADYVTGAEKVHAFGYLNSMGSFAFMIAPTLAGFVVEHFGGYSMLFGIVSFCFGLNVLFTYFFFPIETKTEEAREKAMSRKRMGALQKLVAETKQERRLQIDWACHWDLMAIRIIQSTVMLLYRSNFNWIMEEKFGTSPIQLGYLTSIQSLSAFVFSLISGRVIVLYSRSRVQCFSHATLGSAMCFVGVYLAPNLYMYVACLVCLSACSAVLRVLMMDLTVDRCSPQELGLVIGLGASAVSASRAIAPGVAGALHDYNRDTSVLISVGGTTLAWGIVHLHTYYMQQTHSKHKPIKTD